MKAAAFDYVRPLDVAGALTALRDDPDAKVIAGGQSLVPMMNLRLARPATLVDIGGLPGLDRIIEDDDSLIIGALVRHRTLERDPLVAARTPLLASVAGHIGHPGIRNRGTLGGTLAHADPAAELPLAMVTLDATIHVESIARGKRAIPARDFFASFFTTALDDDELVTWVRVPALTPGQGWGFVEFARRHGDFAMAGAAVLLKVADDGGVAAVRAALMAVGDRPLLVAGDRLRAAVEDGAASAEARAGGGDAVLAGEPGPRMWAEAAEAWTAGLPSTEDPVLTRRLAGTALRRALADAYARARGRPAARPGSGSG